MELKYPKILQKKKGKNFYIIPFLEYNIGLKVVGIILSKKKSYIWMFKWLIITPCNVNIMNIHYVFVSTICKITRPIFKDTTQNDIKSVLFLNCSSSLEFTA